MNNKEASEKLKELLFMTGYKEALNFAINALDMAALERAPGEWVEVKTRPCTDEEFEEYKRLYGDDIDRNEFPHFICHMPSDGDEILICTSWGVDKDKCEYDSEYGYELEERGDWEDVIAWMPLPAPYKKEDEA